MSEDRSPLFRPDLNRSIFAYAGVLLLREVEHKLAVTQDLGDALSDPRNPALIRYTTAELLRECLYAIAIGYAPPGRCQRDLPRSHFLRSCLVSCGQ